MERLIVVEIKVLKLTHTSNLVLRYWADDLFKFIENLHKNKLTLDFSGIVFMSRSFAHEYLKLKKSAYIQITEKNMNKDLRQMLRIVANANIKTENDQTVHHVIL